MAQRVQIVHTDDLDGSEAASSVVFGFEGVSYEIDLSEANKDALAQALAPYIGAARRTAGGRKATPSARRRPAAGASATEVRAWATAHGMQVSARGRVSAEIREAYENAHR
ncbi:MAG: Lsr2 family protein [Propionibacteriaceae bacterium]|nr:Lsr2 family protein [Propionibacteriaceae bacterium]